MSALLNRQFWMRVEPHSLADVDQQLNEIIAPGEIGGLEHVRWGEATAVIEGVAEHGITPDRQSVFATAEAGNPAALAPADRYAEILATGPATIKPSIHNSW